MKVRCDKARDVANIDAIKVGGAARLADIARCCDL